MTAVAPLEGACTMASEESTRLLSASVMRFVRSIVTLPPMTVEAEVDAITGAEFGVHKSSVRVTTIASETGLIRNARNRGILQHGKAIAKKTAYNKINLPISI